MTTHQLIISYLKDARYWLGQENVVLAKGALNRARACLDEAEVERRERRRVFLPVLDGSRPQTD
jgi:hypothetical protein